MLPWFTVNYNKLYIHTELRDGMSNGRDEANNIRYLNTNWI